MTEDEGLTLWLGATRYYMGRMSAGVSDFCALLRRRWPALGARTRALIQRDVEEAFARDDSARAMGLEHKALGMDCDREQWERVRALWRGE